MFVPCFESFTRLNPIQQRTRVRQADRNQTHAFLGHSPTCKAAFLCQTLHFPLPKSVQVVLGAMQHDAASDLEPLARGTQHLELPNGQLRDEEFMNPFVLCLSRSSPTFKLPEAFL